mgnify:FL=1
MTNNNAVPSSQKQRDFWFDNAKSFLIICVFMGHICECLIKTVPFEGGTPIWLNNLFKFIYVFHMPVFMIISGRFAKGRVTRNDWVTSINKLVVPYVVVQFFMMLFYCIVGYSKVSYTSFFSPGYGLWYILVLGIYQIITPHLLKIFHNKWLLFIASLSIMVILLFQRYPFPAPIPRIINFYPFFIFGYLTADYSFDFCKKAIFRILSILAFFGLFIAMNYDSVIEVALLSGKRTYIQYYNLLGLSKPELLVITVVRYLAGFLFFLFIMGISPVKKHFGTILGTNSTYIYILHLFIVVALTALSKSHHILDFCANETFAVILLILTIPISYILISPPVMKLTRWLVSPNFSLKKIIETIMK